MRLFAKLLVASALSAGMLVAPQAYAATFVTNVLSKPPFPTPSPFNLSNNIGTIAGKIVHTGNDYDWKFTLGGNFDVLMQMQASMRGTLAQPISFNLWSGTPSLPGSMIGPPSPYTPGSSIEMVLPGGQYFLQLTSSNIAVDGELVSGSLDIRSAVPEPAAWTMLITGFGVLGAMRRRRRAEGVAAV